MSYETGRVLRGSVLISLVAISLILCGCASVVSDQPLSSPKSAVRDTRLEGMWKSTDKKDQGYIYAVYGKRGMGTILNMGPDGEDAAHGLGAQEMSFFVTRTATRDYLNLKYEVVVNSGKAKEADESTYTFVTYRFDWMGRLIYSGLSVDPIVNAVKAGKLKGRITYDNKGKPTEVHLTDTSKRILDFIESMPAKQMFVKVAVLKKVGGL